MFKLKTKLLLFIFIAFITIAKSENIKDSLECIEKNDTNYVLCLTGKAEKLKNNSEKAIEIAKKAFTLSKTLNYFTGIDKSISVLITNMEFVGKNNEAIELLKEVLPLYIKKDDKYRLATINNNLGVLNRKIGKYDISIEYIIEALNAYELISDSLGIAQCLNNLGVTYQYTGEYKTSIEYFEKSKQIKILLKDTIGIANCNINIGIAFMNIEKYDKAPEYFSEALALYQSKNSLKGIAQTYQNLGVAYEKLKNPEKSMQYYLSALDIYKRMGSQENLAVSYNNIGEAYLGKKQYKKAEEFLLNSLTISKEIKYTELSLHTTRVLKNLHAQSGDFKKAYDYFAELKTLEDSLYESDKIKNLQELQKKYDTEKKEKEIEILNKDKKIQATEIKSQKLQKYIFIGGFGFILIITFVFYRNIIQKKKANKLLSQKNIEIQQQKEEIQTQAEYLEVVNKELEKLSIVASETDNSVVITDAKGEIEWVNDGFTRLFEYTKDEFISEYSSNIKTASKNSDIETAIQTCINKMQTVEYITINKTKTGKLIWTHTTLTPIMKDGKLLKLVAIDSDITMLKQAEEEIQQQQEELRAQSELLHETNNQLELKNTQITDSIRYAKQIQDALLPSSDFIKQHIPSSFIFFKPKDIVSGDFYWFKVTDEYMFIALIDCTGHGVPGAFMSMIGNTILNEIVIQKRIYDPSIILKNLDEGVIYTLLKQKGEVHSQEDGMEISLCRIDKKNKKLQIASTIQSVYVIENDNISEIEGGIYSIGGILYENKKFECHKINYINDIRIYMYSDGFADQFGGENNKKYSSSQFKKLIGSICNQPFENQITMINSEFEQWKGNNKQTDDITILGLKI